MLKFLLGTCVAFFFHSSAFATLQPLSIEDIIHTRKPVSMEMSPDGKFIVYTLTKPRKLFHHDDGDNWREMYLLSKRGNIIPFLTGGEAIGQLHWSADSETIWFLAKRVNSRQVGLYAISTNGGEARLIARHDTNIRGFDISDDNQSIIYWAPPTPTENQQQKQNWGFNQQVFDEDTPKNALWYIDLKENQAEPKLLFNQQHVLKAHFHPKKSQILVQSSPSANKDSIVMEKALRLIDLQGETVIQFKHLGKMGKVSMSPDGKYVAIIGTNTPHFPAEGRLLLGRTDQTELVSLLPELVGQVIDVDWLSTKTIGFIVHQGTGSYLASKRINRPYTKVTDKLKKLSSTGAILRKMSVSEDGDQIGLVADSPEHPQEIYWYSGDGLFQYTDSNPWLSERLLGRQQVMTFKARDGLEIEGILVHPREKATHPLPLIIFVHGGPEVHFSNGWLNRYSHPAHVAANKGYASFFPNYRGSTGKSTAFLKAGQQDYAGKEFDDLIDARQFLIDQGIADPNRVGITGASYGGYAAAWAATKYTEYFAASVSSMGIANQLSKFGTTDIPTEMYRLHSFAWPWEKWQWMLERSPVFHSAKGRTPLLLLHGKRDTRVHYSQSLELYRYLKLQDNAPVRLVLYPEEGHGFARSAAKFDYATRLMRWMDHFLIDKQTSLPALEIPLPDKKPEAP